MQNQCSRLWTDSKLSVVRLWTVKWNIIIYRAKLSLFPFDKKGKNDKLEQHSRREGESVWVYVRHAYTKWRQSVFLASMCTYTTCLDNGHNNDVYSHSQSVYEYLRVPKQTMNSRRLLSLSGRHLTNTIITCTVCFSSMCEHTVVKSNREQVWQKTVAPKVSSLAQYRKWCGRGARSSMKLFIFRLWALIVGVIVGI